MLKTRPHQEILKSDDNYLHVYCITFLFLPGFCLLSSFPSVSIDVEFYALLSILELLFLLFFYIKFMATLFTCTLAVDFLAKTIDIAEEICGAGALYVPCIDNQRLYLGSVTRSYLSQNIWTLEIFVPWELKFHTIH